MLRKLAIFLTVRREMRLTSDPNFDLIFVVMFNRLLFLKLKRFLTATFFLAVWGAVVFSTASGNGTTAGTDEPPMNPPASKSKDIEPGKEKNGTSDSSAPLSSGHSQSPEKKDETPVSVRPERTMSIGIRKVYAPESEVQQWPLGNKKYTFINAQKFESKYKLWKEFLSDMSSDTNAAASRPDVCIESARYFGTVSSSGELSGWGEWKVVVNRQMQDDQTETGSIAANSDNGAGSGKEKGAAMESSLNGFEFGNQKFELFLNSKLEFFLSDFVFYNASEDNLPEPKNESKTEESHPLPVDSETRYPVEQGVVSACFPNGQMVLYIPSEGTVRFRWKAKRLELNNYQIQAPSSIESLWTIDVPSNQKLTLKSENSDCEADALCASVTKERIEETDSWRYSIRWSESETAVVHIGSTDEVEERFDRFYQQQTTYTFSPFHLNTRCRITFEPDSHTELPQTIPFSVVHDPRVIWEASFDGQPAEIHITETGYSVSLRNCKTENPRPELVLTSNCPLGDVKNESQESEKDGQSSPSDISTLSLPRIELKSCRWQSGTAIIYTLQSPKSIETIKCSVIDCKRIALRRFQTIVEQETPEADVVLVIEPFKELFYSQTQTVVQWDGSQASFISTIELQAEEGRLYSLTAVLPEGLTIDQASAEEQPDLVEDWEVNAEPDNPAKRTLTIYLRKSLSPGRSLVLNIRSHAIADWSRPIELNRLAPIVFDRFESHTHILYVNVALNQRFIIEGRVLYSPEQPDDSSMTDLPIGIDCMPHSSSTNGTETGRVDAYEFCIDLRMWGNSLASLEPVLSDYAVNAKTTIWVDKNSMEEKIELAFSGERSYLSQFRFSYGHSSDAPGVWQGYLVWSDNKYKVNVEPVEDNVFSIDIPRNVSSPFTVYLSRKVDWDKQRAFEVLGSSDCSRLTASVSVHSWQPRLFDIHTYGMKFVKSATDDNADFTIGTYEYDVTNVKQESENDGLTEDASSDGSEIPRIEISSCSAPPSDVSIWAWNQLVEERHFVSGNVLTSAQWTIENRFPSQDSIQASDASNSRLKITLPTESPEASGYGFKPFLTGVRIDNESVSGEDIIQESEDSYYILLPPKKKVFILTVQWTSFDSPLKTCSSFHPQKPILDIKVLQTRWDLYYPTCYRRLNSFLSSDPSVDGWLERFFGPLLRRDSVAIMSIVSHIWETDQDENAVKKEEYKSIESSDRNGLSLSQKIKATSSNAVFPDPYMLPGAAPWNCCRFEGSGAPKTIRIVRSEVSESIRWTFFIITVSTILALYFKRADILQSKDVNNEKTDEEEKKGIASWGFRRWVCILGIASSILCQALPWFLSLFFSGVFLGSIVCLLVLAVPFGNEKTNNGEDSNAYSRTSIMTNASSRISVSTFRFLFLAAAVLTMQSSYGQESVLPPSDSRYMSPRASEQREYEIFVPVDQQNLPKSGYYVPQELLDLMQTRENRSLERSWIVCRTQYYGKLFQKPRQTESGLWKCAIEIETLTPNAAVNLPIQLRETVSTTSSISVSRGRILRNSPSKSEEANSDNSTSETLYWSWDKLDNQTVLQWNPKNERWGIRLAQPGRYLIEAEFRPSIVVTDGKNEISFPILECINSTFELLVPENITGLEFPGAFGGVTELTANMEITDPTIPSQPGVKLKRVQLGAAKQLTVRWNAGGFLSDGPVFDVDTITWWNVLPESVDVKIKYNVKVVSGSVSSVKIIADERLALLSESTIEKQDKQSENESPEEELETQTKPDKNENQGETNNVDSTAAAGSSSLKKKTNALQSGVHYTVISNPETPNEITVEFDNPVTSQTSFELHYIWKDAVGVGRLQFPTTSVEASRSGQRTLAFTFDSRLQYECASDLLVPLSVQSFGELWRGFQKQTVPVSDKDAVSTERGNRIVVETIPDVSIETDSPTKRLPLPSPPQTSSSLPTVAYDLNLSRRKTDSSGVVDSVVMNVQRTKASSEGTLEAYVLVDWNRLLWQIKWTINITRGERNAYSATLPEALCKSGNNLSIISASVNTLEIGSGGLYPVNSRIEGNELKLYWGIPVEGKCQLTVTGEIRPNFEDGTSNIHRVINFDFPDIKTLNVTQYKLAIGRTDNSVVQTVFDKPTAKTVVWIQSELSMESPFSSRHQRLLETWQTTISDASKKPCPLALEIQKNDVVAEIDASVKLVPESASALAVNGRVRVAQGILDEFQLDIPENCFAPISSKTTLKCELDAMSISQRRYILRPLSPFSADSEFELTIPLKKPESGNWKLEKQSSSIWAVVRSGETPQTEEPTPELESVKTASLPDNSKGASVDAHSPDCVTKVFGLKMYVKPVSEASYCAAAEFACSVSGTDSVCVCLPKGSKTLNVQIDQRSVRWVEKKAGETLIPMFTENDPVDVRIVYTAPFNRNLYTDPMKFEPPTIQQAQQPDILWMVIPWKSLGYADPNAVRTTSFISKQIWLINDLNNQFQFLQQFAGNFSPRALERLSGKLDEIESQLKQYELRGEKPKALIHSDALISKPESIRLPNLTAMETGAIRLAMQNVLRLREAINEKQKSYNKNLETVKTVGSSVNDSALLEFQASPALPLIGTSDPGTTFVMTYSLPPASASTTSIWQILLLLFIPIIIWLAFFPPELFLLWRPSFVLVCLSVIWLLCFNCYGVSIALLVAALFDILSKLRQRSKKNIISLRVR